jgi:hypothetical protein
MENYGGTKHTGIPVKTLKKILKKAGLKVSGKKATLTRRAKRAKLFGGNPPPKSSVRGLFENQRILPEFEQAQADAAKAQEQRQKEIDQRLQDYRKSATTSSNDPPPPSSLYKGIRNVFTGLGKKKRSRRS